jgi:mono/diheme cytochrome c family protein
MRRLTFIGIGCGFGLALIMAFGNAPAAAQEPQELMSSRAMQVAGSNNFDQYCVTCHGKDGKGKGPLASSLNPKPADLTGIALRNGGTYPAQMVFDVIDGAKKVKGHGGGDMPEWGDAFGKSAHTDGMDGAKKRIETLVAFLETIQTK